MWGCFALMFTLEEEKIRRGRLKAAGFCRAHVNRPVVSATKCRECLDKASNAMRKRRVSASERGVCCMHPERPVVPGKKSCWECSILYRIKDARLLATDRAKVLEAFRLFNGYCQCCGGTRPGPKGWCLDHDHVTHQFRGIICGFCNTMLGMARESAQVLSAGIRYLNEYARIRPVTSQAEEGSTPSDSTDALTEPMSASAGSPGFDA